MIENVRKRLPLATVLVVIFLSPALKASNILPGDDLFTAPDYGGNYYTFTNFPIPLDFFGPGSDPFFGRVDLEGLPLNTIQPGILGPTDTVVRRPGPSNTPSCGDSDLIPIEIVALNLVSVNPITVTYNGGQFNELWNVNVCLSSTQPQQPGTAVIHHGCDAGGTFTATLPVIPKVTFTRADDPNTIRELDFGIFGLPPVMFETYDGYWTHSDHGFNIISSPGGVIADHNCDGIIDKPIGPGSNFFPGVVGSPCFCGYEPYNYNIAMTCFQTLDGTARLCLVPTQMVAQVPTLSEWGLLILGLFTLTAATIALVGKKAVFSRIPA